MTKHIRTEIIINASSDTVWTLLTDFKRYPSWNPFIIAVEGEAVKGTRLKNTLHNNGKDYVFKPIVIESIRPKRFSWLGSLFVRGIFDGHHYFEIEELGPNQVKLLHGEKFSGLLSNYIYKKIGNETRGNFVRMNQALKTLAEKK